jgi:hypothetical protein
VPPRAAIRAEKRSDIRPLPRTSRPLEFLRGVREVWLLGDEESGCGGGAPDSEARNTTRGNGTNTVRPAGIYERRNPVKAAQRLGRRLDRIGFEAILKSAGAAVRRPGRSAGQT